LLEINLSTIYPLSLGESLLPIFLEKLTSTFTLFEYYLFSITWTNFCPIFAYCLFPYYLTNFALFFHTIYLLLSRQFHLLILERLLKVLFFWIPFSLPLYFEHIPSLYAIHPLLSKKDLLSFVLFLYTICPLLPREFHLLILRGLVFAQVFFPLDTFLLTALFWTSFSETLLCWFFSIHTQACWSYLLRPIS